jgi:hypothetical protein
MAAAAGGTSFGSCCESLKAALSGGDFEPLMTIDNDGVLYVTVGLVEMDTDEPGMLDHPMFFCPFCGTRLQNAEQVDAKNRNAASGQATDRA